MSVVLGVLAAMPEEASAIVAALGGDVSVYRHGRRAFHRAVWHGREVVVVVSRIGKVSAAATTAELIVRFGVGAIVVTGVAGAVGPGVHVGDVVVADEVVQHDLDASPLWPPRVVPLLEVEGIAADARVAGALAASAEALRAGGGVGPVRCGAVHRGLVASGDVFVADAGRASSIRAALPGVLAVEMEGAAVGQVAYEHGVPFGVVRAISDVADGEAAGHFTGSLGAFAAAYGLGIVRGAIARLEGVM